MPLLNYTTSVAADRTIGQVHKMLVRAGARQIGTEYDSDGEPTSVAFVVDTAHGPRGFMLPIDAGAVEKVLARQGVEPRYRTPEHARRVAWRIVKDWLEAQLAIIETEMVSLDQVMLPYMRADDGRTMYELYRDRQLALPAGAP